jgi:2-dehydro-3-deoxyphosphogluconate aldolase / (4S)-4-hydroxy-2-oxoglutarate aldolase
MSDSPSARRPAPQVWAAIDGAGVVPVAVIDDPAAAAPLVEALQAGGLPCCEITLRTPDAFEALRRASAVEGVMVGVGTVVSADQVDEAVAAGAAFVVSPGLDEEVAARCAEIGIPFLPGVATATEVMRAQRLGLERLKLFPVSQLGGLAAVDALAAPFGNVRLMPSGGVRATEVSGYLAHPNVFAVAGGWVAPRAVVAAGDFDQIRDNARSTAAQADRAWA